MKTNPDEPFEILPYRVAVDKDINIIGPGDLSLSVDYDDVDHPSVEADTAKMLRILNKYWDTES